MITSDGTEFRAESSKPVLSSPSCAAHDEDLDPFCSALFPPDFCDQSFCFVDSSCSSDRYESSYFPGYGLYYSYETCGSINSFITWATDDVPRSMTDLIALVEAYVLSAKQALEENVQQVRDLVQTGATEECNLVSSCDGCTTCEENECWGQPIDSRGVNVVFNPNLENVASADEIEELSCMAGYITSTYRRTAAKEYNDDGRIAFQYFGSQSTGAMVQWPATEFCSYDFDARQRPWYASAASGQKDVVLVIDVSGSMTGTRIALARDAVKAVLRTFTWEALSSAGQMLSGSSACNKAILFMTDGEDNSGFNEASLSNIPSDVIIFSYALGSGAIVEPLQNMACSTSGIFYSVFTANELPDVMASYYQYFVQLADPCAVNWIQYTDAVTGAELLGGCTAIFDTTTNETVLQGVNCVDLNLIVDPNQLRTCSNDAYNSFVELVRGQAELCGSQSAIDSCALKKLRQAVGNESECPGDDDVDSCENTNIAFNATSCPPPNANRFNDIILQDCETDFDDCGFATQEEEDDDGINWGFIQLGFVAGSAICLGCLYLFGAGPAKSQDSASSSESVNDANEEDLPVAVAVHGA
ncbi:Voltage-dependent calcium channel subunit alpha-2/delta-2 [Hondaea fermentalgiana]|uniref:Voltage-dependent calcium channel subunit alpha-2/delta-2 n=1 Tax=Hondaea fermentalgiana TaxID=2315210 RepID=A0A2R5G925_9STRA|nr:Voltage-dependent calcium channel subunit alpha-2/delta-2 [Hondaea fermentalgiana]|eukprot:GBG27566.1 Voltage-dependent calcium channel subunit alpha-2/delta-2 [Hondaea fermentalgiana]